MGYQSEVNLLVPLGMITYWFRYRVLRQEATRLLLEYPRRKGLGDEEFVPHSLAAELASFEWDSIAKTAKFVAYKKFIDEARKLEKMEAIVRW
jgi:hypothetical protein